MLSRETVSIRHFKYSRIIESHRHQTNLRATVDTNSRRWSPVLCLEHNNLNSYLLWGFSDFEKHRDGSNKFSYVMHISSMDFLNTRDLPSWASQFVLLVPRIQCQKHLLGICRTVLFYFTIFIYNFYRCSFFFYNTGSNVSFGKCSISN